MMSRVKLIRAAPAVLAVGSMSVAVSTVIGQSVVNPPPVAQAGSDRGDKDPRIAQR